MNSAKGRRHLENGGHLVLATGSSTERSSEERDPILQVQLAMATSSINHEYARMEYDESSDTERREELLHYMDDCRQKYDEAREQLTKMSPTTVEQFERDLAYQKRTTLHQYHA